MILALLSLGLMEIQNLAPANHLEESPMKLPKPLYHLLLLLMLGISATAQAVDLSGRYSASGTNPGGQGSYRGYATISRSGDTYKIVWKVGEAYSGTGVVTDEVFSVAYTDAARKWFGMVSYRILDGGDKLQGVWCAHGGKVLGTELLIRQ
jgi:hypothetical protein